MSLFGKKVTSEEDEQVPVSAQQAPHIESAPHPSYGIEDAIRLMRSLPTDQNVDLIVRVVKRTLESMNVRLTDILSDATQKQKALEARINGLQLEVAELEKQVAARRGEIARLENALAETTSVRERLSLADVASQAPPATSSKTPSAPSSKAPPPPDKPPTPDKPRAPEKPAQG